SIIKIQPYNYGNILPESMPKKLEVIVQEEVITKPVTLNAAQYRNSIRKNSKPIKINTLKFF
uniref:hypothetical protein n=1 Tax=Pseudoalteromonas issachenkonii TaxID=152297 RepID=UPI0023538376